MNWVTDKAVSIFQDLAPCSLSIPIPHRVMPSGSPALPRPTREPRGPEALEMCPVQTAVRSVKHVGNFKGLKNDLTAWKMISALSLIFFYWSHTETMTSGTYWAE